MDDFRAVKAVLKTLKGLRKLSFGILRTGEKRGKGFGSCPVTGAKISKIFLKSSFIFYTPSPAHEHDEALSIIRILPLKFTPSLLEYPNVY